MLRGWQCGQGALTQGPRVPCCSHPDAGPAGWKSRGRGSRRRAPRLADCAQPTLPPSSDSPPYCSCISQVGSSPALGSSALSQAQSSSTWSKLKAWIPLPCRETWPYGGSTALFPGLPLPGPACFSLPLSKAHTHLSVSPASSAWVRWPLIWQTVGPEGCVGLEPGAGVPLGRKAPTRSSGDVQEVRFISFSHLSSQRPLSEAQGRKWWLAEGRPQVLRLFLLSGTRGAIPVDSLWFSDLSVNLKTALCLATQADTRYHPQRWGLNSSDVGDLKCQEWLQEAGDPKPTVGETLPWRAQYFSIHLMDSRVPV